MINAQDIKSKLTLEMLRTILIGFGAKIYYEDDDKIVMNTFCHGGKSVDKLWYYKNSQVFECFTECGTFDILELICKIKDYKFIESVNWLANKLGISTYREGFGDEPTVIKDWEFIENIRKKRRRTGSGTDRILNFYDSQIFNVFQNKYYRGWIDEGISIETMQKYGIQYCALKQSIIIPHYDINNQLLGIRQRCLIDEDIDRYGKYTPLYYGGVLYNHPLTQNLFGLNHNADAIRRKQKIMLVEAEKSVLQTDTMFGEDNFTVSLCGSNVLSNHQRDLILSLGVKKVIIAVDKQWTNEEEMLKWAEHIRKKIIDKLAPYVTVEVLWDTFDILGYKDSPTDRGKDSLLFLMENKLYVGCR